jgi:excisionase family DNA binding protein
MPGDKQWITVAEAAEKSGYAISTIQQLLREGRIAGWKPGHDWFTTLDAVMEYKRRAKMGRPKKKK